MLFTFRLEFVRPRVRNIRQIFILFFHFPIENREKYLIALTDNNCALGLIIILILVHVALAHTYELRVYLFVSKHLTDTRDQLIYSN